MLAGQVVSIREVADEIWFVSLMNYDLGGPYRIHGLHFIPDTYLNVISCETDIRGQFI